MFGMNCLSNPSIPVLQPLRLEIIGFFWMCIIHLRLHRIFHLLHNPRRNMSTILVPNIADIPVKVISPNINNED